MTKKQRLRVIDGQLQVRSFLVIPDSNVLQLSSAEKTPVQLNAAFVTSWGNLMPSDDVTLLVPEVVFGELAYQQVRHVLKLVDDVAASVDKIAQFASLDVKIELPDQQGLIAAAEGRVKSALDAAVVNWKREAAPFEKIRLDRIVDDAVWRRPPFAKDGEKGFRDYVILETVKNVVSKNPTRNVFFISKDGLLRTSAQRALAKYSHFAAYETVDQFVSFLSAVRGAFSWGFVKAVEKEAPAKFYRAGDQNTYWYHAAIDDQIRKRFQKIFDNPEAPEGSFFKGDPYQWKLVGELKSSVAHTKFAGLVGEKEFRWSTGVQYVGVYERLSRPTFFADETMERSRFVFTFSVDWSVQVSDEGEFSSFRLSGIQAFRPSRLPGGPTLLGATETE